MALRRHLPCAVLSLGAAVALWGSSRPWLASGRAERSSYELLDLLGRLGIDDSTAVVWAVRAWPLMPLLLVSGVVVAWWGRPVLGSVVGLCGAAYASAIALAVTLAPGDRLIRWLPGVTITLVGGTLAGVGAVATILSSWRSTRRALPARLAASPDGRS